VSALRPGWSTGTIDALVGKGGIFTDGDWVESKDQDPAGDVRLIQLADVGEGVFRDRSRRFLTGAAAERLGCTFLQTDDVLVARMPDPLGRACLVPMLSGPSVTAVDVCIVRTGDGVNSRWLMWALNAPAVRSQIAALQSGTTRKRISRKNLATIALPVPPAAEQRRIVAAIEEQFSRLDAADRALERATRTLRGLRTASVDLPMDGGVQVPLSELLAEPLRNGHSAKAQVGGHTRILTLTAVTKGIFTEENTKAATPDPDRVRDLWLRPGDILIQRSNTPELVGTAALYRGPERWAIFPDLLIRIRVSSRIEPEYLNVVLGTPRARAYFRSAAQGIAGSMPKIDQGTVERFRVTVPALDEQRRIVAEVERRLSVIDAMAAAIDSARRRSAALRRSILERAFRGELVPQDPSDEPASVLLERIRAERAAEGTPRRRRRASGDADPAYSSTVADQ
jgi:type I restriction enzyme, S subunit